MDSTLTAETMEFPEQKRKQAIETANSITRRMADIYEDDLGYYFSLKGTPYLKYVERDMGQAMAVFQELIRMSQTAGQTEITKNLQDRFKKLEAQYSGS
jgi:hypothetical protein